MTKRKGIVGIYRIYSKCKQESYIGCSVNVKSRISCHFAALRHNVHHSNILQNHFNKYGESDLSWEILELVENKTDLVQREQYYIDLLIPYFNVCRVAGRCDGRPISEETREKLRNAFLGRKLTEEHKKKISLNNARKPMSPEHKAKLTAINKAIKRTDAQKRHLSLLNTGKKATKEAKANMREAWFRDPNNLLHLQKVSEGNKGRKWTPEYRKRMEAIMATPEYKAKISATGKNRKWTEEQKERCSRTWHLKRSTKIAS